MDQQILIVMILQTLIFAGSLVFLAIQVRSQVSATRTEVYNRCWSDYSSLVRMLVANPSLQSIYDDLSEKHKDKWKWPSYTAREKTLYNYFELIYELFERVYFLAEDRWIDSETWSHWNAWLSEVCEHPLFEDVAHDNEGMFAKEFQEFVFRRIKELRNSKKT